MKTPRLTRRQFLTAIGAGGAAAAAATATRDDSGGRRPDTASVPQGKGYQVTEHVRRYYETTKV